MEDELLIPDLIEYRKLNGEDFSIDSWTAIEGNIKLAIGYSLIFWPDFIEHDDCVFVNSGFSVDNFNNWVKTEYVMHFAQIENVLNHIHVLDLFSSEKQNEINYHQIKFLGNKLREIYDAKLKCDFPHRQFTVKFNGDEKLELDEYEITFYQEINESRKTNNGR